MYHSFRVCRGVNKQMKIFFISYSWLLESIIQQSRDTAERNQDFVTWGKKAHADLLVCCFTDLQQHFCIVGGGLLDFTQSSSCVISSSERYLPPVYVCCLFGSFVAYSKSSTFKLKSISFAWWFLDCKTRQRTYCKMYLNIYWTYTRHIFHICHLTSQAV